MYLYACGPLDCWPAMMTLAEALALAGSEDVCTPTEPIALLGEALHTAASQGHWDGDFSVEPRFCPIPGGDVCMDWGVIWKQSNNGTTFVYSPHELPWLAQWRV